MVKPVITHDVAGETTEHVLDTVAEPVDDTEVTFVCPVVAYVKVVEEGTDATVNVPLNAVATAAMMTLSPTLRLCAVDVVSVAIFEVSARLVTVEEAKAPPELLNVVTNIDVVGPTVVPEAAAGVGVTVTSVFPESVRTVGTPGAIKFHCG